MVSARSCWCAGSGSWAGCRLSGRTRWSGQRPARRRWTARSEDEETGDDDGSPEWIDPQAFEGLARSANLIRTMGQRRADALVDICQGVLGDPRLPKRHGQRPTVQVTGGVLTLLGLRNDPGELAGYGPITAGHLREIAADGDWHRYLTAPDTGALISIGTVTYRPKQALRTFMIAAQPPATSPAAGSRPNAPTPNTPCPIVTAG